MNKGIGKRLIVLFLAICVLGSWGPVLAEDELTALHSQMAAAWNVSDFTRVADLGRQYMKLVEEVATPGVGTQYAQVAYMFAYSRYKLFKDGNQTMPPIEFRKEIINPLRDNIRIMQSNDSAILTVLGKAYFDLYKLEDPKTLETQNWANWFLYQGIINRFRKEKMLMPVTRPLAGMIIFYVRACMDIVEISESPDIYGQRIRDASSLGAGTEYASYLDTLYKMTFFDDGNIKAGVLYQKGLNESLKGKEFYDPAVEYFKLALDRTNSKKAKAEIWREMADLTSLFDEPEKREIATQCGARAYALNPDDIDIRNQYGSSLYLQAVGLWNKKQYKATQRSAKQATGFEWKDKDRALLLQAMAEQNLGLKYEAITHAREAYQRAAARYSGDDMAEFETVYKNILEQFGESDRFRSVKPVKKEVSRTDENREEVEEQ